LCSKIIFSHGCRWIDGIFPRLSQIFMVPENQKNSEKILKIIQKFPHLLERAENAENAWEIPENRGKNLE